MPIELPPLLTLGGAEAFAGYQAEFDRFYHSGEVRDALDRLVVFSEDRCKHVCFKDQPGDADRKLPRVWAQERAERIPWIRLALTMPVAIHPSHNMLGRQAYLLEGSLELPSGSRWERFIVYVEPEQTRRPKKVWFVTAFPPDTVKYWNDAKNAAPRIYPKKRR